MSISHVAHFGSVSSSILDLSPTPWMVLGNAGIGSRISLDTTRTDHFGCYGNPWIRTPHTDALAAESVLFTNYMTVASSTLPSHTSLFTGKYPQNYGVPGNGFMVHKDNRMMTETTRFPFPSRGQYRHEVSI